MYNRLIIFALFALSLNAFLPLEMPSDSNSEEFTKRLFEQFKSAYGKNYSSPAEQAYRFGVFKSQLAKMTTNAQPLYQQVNITTSSESQGAVKITITRGNDPCGFVKQVNSFADLSDEEFSRTYLSSESFFTKNIKPENIIQFETQTSDTEELQIKLKDPNFDPFHEALAGHQQESLSNKINQGDSPAKKLLLDILRPQSERLANKKPSETGVSDSCVSFLYKEQRKTNQTITTEGGSITRNALSHTTIAFKQQTAAGAESFFPHSFRRLQSYSRRGNYNQYNNRNSNRYNYQNDEEDQPQEDYYSNNNDNRLPNQPSDKLPFKSQTARKVTIDGVRVPSYLNWKEANIISGVKNQKSCASCYAFAGIGALEANNALYNDDNSIFSEQEIIDCSDENNGCIGGLPSLVFEYVRDNGISTESEYPYKSLKTKGTCDSSSSKYDKFSAVKGNFYLKNGVLSLIKALQFGPVSVITYASQEFKYYKSGVFQGEGCDGVTKPNHSSVLIGYDLKAPIPYFLLKNAWGSAWGDYGFFKMAIGPLNNQNMGICLLASTGFNAFPLIKTLRK